MLHAIPKYDVNRIQSAQVITSLSDAIKELLENSIDSGAKKITIRFFNNGLSSIEIVDDGSGVAEHNFEALVARNATSKLGKFSDLDELRTLGFRGEALSSICSLSDLNITTCTKSTYPMGFTLEYDHEGTLISKKTTSAPIGTTVRVENLFSTLPVRRKDFEKNAKRDFIKATKLLQAYAAINVDLRLEALHFTGKSRHHVLGLHGTTGSRDLRRNITDLFGTQLGKVIVALDTTLTFESDSSFRKVTIHFSGYISSPQKEYGGQPDRQLIYINSRPCQLPQVTRMINETCSSLGSNRSPFLLLNLSMPPDSYDVNVSPDKRTIYLHDEQVILNHLRETLTKLFTDDERTLDTAMPDIANVDRQYKPSTGISSLAYSPGVKHELEDSVDIDSHVEFYGRHPLAENVEAVEDRSAGNHLNEAREHLESVPPSSEMDIDLNTNVPLPITPAGKAIHSAASMDDERDTSPELSTINLTSTFTYDRDDANSPTPYDNPALSAKRKRLASASILAHRQAKLPFHQVGTTNSKSVSPQDSDEDGLQNDDTHDSNQAMADHSDEHSEHIDEASASGNEENRSEPEQAGTFQDGILEAASDVRHVKPLQRFMTRLSNFEHSPASHQVHGVKASIDTNQFLAQEMSSSADDSPARANHERDILIQAGLEDSTEVAEESLSLNVSKTDFFKMTVIGQFNLGFILVSHNDNLFIIDQHASDEKSNYEKLIRETVLQSQKMARSRKLELSSIEKLSIDEHLPTLKKNGFEIEVAQESEDDEESQYYLTSLPVSRNIAFDASDLQEILHSLIDGTDPKSVRCIKAKRMFASRACRSSIMIGTALSHDRMQSVVWHLGEMDAPWNCPHGRPTMRHLTNLGAMQPFKDDYT